mgnify:CR=1 FL=1
MREVQLNLVAYDFPNKISASGLREERLFRVHPDQQKERYALRRGVGTIVGTYARTQERGERRFLQKIRIEAFGIFRNL